MRDERWGHDNKDTDELKEQNEDRSHNGCSNVTYPCNVGRYSYSLAEKGASAGRDQGAKLSPLVH